MGGMNPAMMNMMGGMNPAMMNPAMMNPAMMNSSMNPQHFPVNMQQQQQPHQPGKFNSTGGRMYKTDDNFGSSVGGLSHREDPEPNMFNCKPILWFFSKMNTKLIQDFNKRITQIF